MSRCKTWLAGLAVIVLTTLFACAGAEHFEYRSDNEVPEGSGIFSGDDGYFEIIKKEYE